MEEREREIIYFIKNYNGGINAFFTYHSSTGIGTVLQK
jgi:hypothetical protein